MLNIIFFFFQEKKGEKLFIEKWNFQLENKNYRRDTKITS